MFKEVIEESKSLFLKLMFKFNYLLNKQKNPRN